MPEIIINRILLVFLLLISVLSEENKEEQNQNFDEIIYNWSRTFAEVFQLTNQKHYKVSNADQCMIKAIDAFLNCIDPIQICLIQKHIKI